jgi:hypothetical protein
MAVKDGQAKMERKLFGGRRTLDHQLGGTPVRFLHSRRAEPLQRKLRRPQQELQLGLKPTSLLGRRELLEQADPTGEVLDGRLVCVVLGAA